MKSVPNLTFPLNENCSYPEVFLPFSRFTTVPHLSSLNEKYTNTVLVNEKFTNTVLLNEKFTNTVLLNEKFTNTVLLSEKFTNTVLLNEKFTYPDSVK